MWNKHEMNSIGSGKPYVDWYLQRIREKRIFAGREWMKKSKKNKEAEKLFANTHFTLKLIQIENICLAIASR